CKSRYMDLYVHMKDKGCMIRIGLVGETSGIFRVGEKYDGAGTNLAIRELNPSICFRRCAASNTITVIIPRSFRRQLHIDFLMGARHLILISPILKPKTLLRC
ncbi:unnamed protein product, partial [Allacma fusca]